MQTQTNVHVKAISYSDLRRFALTETNFDALQSTIRLVFAFSPEVSFVLKFLDDEKDWISFSTDFELQHAIELSKSLLRVRVVLPDAIDTPVTEGSCPRGEKEKGRGGRGCRGGRGGRGFAITTERLTLKLEIITQRISDLEEILADPATPSDRKRAITWKLDKLKEKAERLTAIKNSTETQPENAEDIPREQHSMWRRGPGRNTEEGTGTGSEGCWGRGRGGRGCRGKMARQGEEEGDHPVGKWVVPKETWAQFQECKENLRNARKSGDAEAIKQALEAFMEAKEKKKEARFLRANPTTL